MDVLYISGCAWERVDIGLCCLLCRYKWGLAEGKLSHSCKIEVEHENGSTVLKQQPFETLDEVYTPVPFVSGHQSAE